jgi:hypothetical protein
MSAGRGRSRLVAASLVGLGVFSAPVLAAPPADIKAYCAGKWAEYSMQAYCIGQEEQAQRKLAAGVSDQQIWVRCYQKWDAWTMVAYCVGQEENAKTKVQGTPAPSMPSPQAPPTATTPSPTPSTTRDTEGVKACFALKDALDVYLASGYMPGLRGRLFSVATQGARSTDPYLRNAMSRLSTSSTSDEMVTWMRITADVCVNRTARPSTTIFGPATAPPPPDAPRAPAAPVTKDELDTMTKRATEQSGAKKCETKTYGGGAAVTVCD